MMLPIFSRRTVNILSTAICDGARKRFWILFRRDYLDARQRRVDGLTRHWWQGHAWMFGEQVGLHDKRWPSLAEVALDSDGDDVAPLHRRSSGSAVCSMKSSRSPSA